VHVEHIGGHEVVIVADVSQPGAVDERVGALPHVRIVEAGYLRLPRDADFRMSAHTGPGEAFACATEALLLGVEPHPMLRLHGALDADAIATLREVAIRHGVLS
jgi:predicted amino acid dehydrogenase